MILEEAHSEGDVKLGRQSLEQVCKVDSNGRWEICETEAAIVKALSDSSTVTCDSWKHVRVVVVMLTVERAGM